MTDAKTATERLRELLDERGVEWTKNDGACSKQTDWPFNGELMAEFNEWENGTTRFDCDTWCFSPEQAIAATLGNDGAERSNDGVAERETCHIVKTWSDSDYDEDWRYRCSECGCFIGVYERDPETGDAISADNYCPNCGRKVVDE